MGLISTGCATCRKRRIKCDEGKPGCKRCFKIGKTCPGYDRGLKIVMYTEDSEARRRTLQANEPKCSSTVSMSNENARPNPSKVQSLPHPPQRDKASLGNRSCELPTPECSQKSKSSTPRLEVIKIRPSLAPDLEIRSICLFISSFVQDPQSSTQAPTFLDFLPDLYTESSPDSCLQQTLRAVAQLNFLNRYKASSTLSEWAKRSYGNALRSVNAALSDRDLVQTDQSLASIWLLSMYELLAPGHLTQEQRTPWANHVNGTLQLLRIRGKDKLLTRTGRQLFRLIHPPIVIMKMMGGNEPVKDITIFNDTLYESSSEDLLGPILVTKHIQRVADVRYRLKAWISDCATRRPSIHEMRKLEDLIVQGLEVDQENDFEAWTSRQIGWQPTGVHTDTFASLEIPSLGRNWFTSTDVMFYWVMFWTTKMLLLQSLVGTFACSAMGPEMRFLGDKENACGTTPFDPQSLKTRVKDLADSILGSVAFAFGDLTSTGKVASKINWSSVYSNSAVGAYHMFYPIGAVLASPYTTADQKVLARSTLHNIGERFCIAQALQYVGM